MNSMYMPGFPYYNPTASYLSTVNGLDMASGLYSGNLNSSFYGGIDGDLGSYSLFNPMMSMNGSCMPGMFGSYGPGSEIMNMTQEGYLKYQNRMNQIQLRQQVDMKKTADAAKIYADSDEDEITRDSANLQRLIKENRQDKILAAYKVLQNAEAKKLKEAGYDISSNPDQVKAEADKAYYAATRSNLIDDIQTHGKSSFFYGFLRGTGIGCAFTNKDDNRDQTMAEVTGVERSNSSKTWETVGRVVGALTVAAAAVVGVASLKRGSGTIIEGLCNGIKRLWSGPAADSIAAITKKQKNVSNFVNQLEQQARSEFGIKTAKLINSQHAEFNASPLRAQLDTLWAQQDSLKEALRQAQQNELAKKIGKII